MHTDMKQYIKPISRSIQLQLKELFMTVSGTEEDTADLSFGDDEGSHEAEGRTTKNLWDSEW